MIATERSRVIDETKSLGMGILVVEAEDGTYQPVSVVGTIREARETAVNDLRNRMQRLERGSEPLCPARYLVWAQGAPGEYATVAEIEAN